MILKQRGTYLIVIVFEDVDAKIVQKVNGSQQSRRTVVAPEAGVSPQITLGIVHWSGSLENTV
jgi:hypothetical protein